MIVTMQKPKPKRRRGRPRLDPDQQLGIRHVVNLTPATDAAVARFCEMHGVAHHVDAMRQLIIKALRAEGLL